MPDTLMLDGLELAHGTQQLLTIATTELAIQGFERWSLLQSISMEMVGAMLACSGQEVDLSWR